MSGMNLSPNIVLSGLGADFPRIYFDNIVTSSSLYAAEAAAAEPASNAANPATYLKWRGVTTAAQYLAVALTAPVSIDYMAIAAHNLGSIRSTVTFQTSADGVTWNNLAYPVAPADDTVLIVEFIPNYNKYWRVLISAANAPPAIGVLYAGRKLVLQRSIYVGHAPITLSRNTIVSTGRSESGQFLGRVFRRETLTSSVDMHHITPEWYRAHMVAFVTAAKTAPFFWRWRPSSYPSESGYAWLTDDVKITNEMSNGMLQFSFNMQALP